MPIRDFEPERVKIEYRGKPLTEVRGLNLIDVTSLINQFLPDIRQVMQLIDDQDAALAAIGDPDFLSRIVSEVPSIAFAVLARSMEVTSDAERAKIPTLPLGVLIEALTATVRLTVEDIGGPNALAALLMKLTNTTRRQTRSAANPLEAEAEIMKRIKSYDSSLPLGSAPVS